MKRIRRILLCILMITVLCGISIVGNFVVKSENKSKEKKRTDHTKGQCNIITDNTHDHSCDDRD